MNMHTRIDLPQGVRHWTHDGSSLPDWVMSDVRGELSPNGTFLIKTPVGTARVHLGNVVIQHQGELWCRNAEEVPDLVAGLRAEELNNVTAIGPGKSAQFGTKSKSAAKKGFRAIVGAPPIIEWVAPRDLSVDPSYQRSIDNAASRRLIASIAASFDWRLFSSLIVSARPDGSRVIIDGQHRWAAAVRRGDLTHLPCCSFSYPTPEDEARMFITANRARKPMNRLDDFYAALAAADEDALEIHRLVTEAGLTVARSMAVNARKPGEISFTSSIAAGLRRHGEAVVSAALTSMAEAFDGESVAQGSSVFNALVLLFAEPPQGFDPDKLVPALRCVNSDGFRNIIRDLQGSEERAVALRIAIEAALQSDRQFLAAA
ncbi:hypothetical protein OVY29_03850 [Sphingopyxis sp. SE2]|uniref:DUF6551 family protein n=1 Tax=Sphingopyxis sp. SE2 TaxID=1586240 RepID=UPI0028BF8619|nr:DUF6551 family protein [Sphingopyxis sp. SE2]MDT7527796.1 hypothetical protein [Sphingopyxis sp. SE2]